MQPSLAPSPHLMRAGQQDSSDQALRVELLNHVNSGLQSESKPQVGEQNSPSSHSHPQNIDPAIAGPGMMSHSPGESGGDDQSGDVKKGGMGKRELSTSKRAAQNRAAQRAFRQRKEGHIKKLEEQVRDYAILSENYKRMQAENYLLRDYIISLQSRLLESQGEIPQPPGNINLDAPRHDAPLSHGAPTADMGASAASQLQASAAQAVAEGRGRDLAERTDPALTVARSSA
ncbi:MAG: hypothetical protein MMC23_001943 [Stictis urceolatum]|nr:hypothetical protein [Stictis urceolata]